MVWSLSIFDTNMGEGSYYLGRCSNCGTMVKVLAADEPSATIELTDANFDEMVTNSKDFWVIDFFAPWCPPCKELLPEFKKASIALEGKVKLGTVNSDEQKGAISKYRVPHYPTVYMFGADKTIPTPFLSREAGTIEWEAMKLTEILNVPVEYVDISTSQGEFDWRFTRYCFVAFLPEEGKAKNMETLQKASVIRISVYNDNVFNAQAAPGKLPGLEKTLGVTTFPALAAVDKPNNKYALYKGAWEVAPMADFFRAPEMTDLSGDLKYEL